MQTVCDLHHLEALRMWSVSSGVHPSRLQNHLGSNDSWRD